MNSVTPGDLLKRIRLERGYTLESLAAAVGLTLGAVAQWENGKTTPKRSSIQRVDDKLGAGGELLTAFGYVTQQSVAEEIAELRQLVDSHWDVTQEMAAQIVALTARVTELDAARVKANRAAQRAAGGSR